MPAPCFCRGLEVDRARLDPIHDFRLRLKPWLQMARTLVSVAVASFYIENKRFDLDTLRVPNRSPTPISKSNDFLGQSGDVWGAPGHHLRPILGARAGLTCFLAL